MGPGPVKNFATYNLGTAKPVLKEVGPKVRFKIVRGFRLSTDSGKHLNLSTLVLVRTSQ